MSTPQPPERLFLQNEGDGYDLDTWEGAAWRNARLCRTDVEYIRADLARPTPSPLAAGPAEGPDADSLVRTMIAFLRVDAEATGLPASYRSWLWMAEDYAKMFLATPSPAQAPDVVEARPMNLIAEVHRTPGGHGLYVRRIGGPSRDGYVMWEDYIREAEAEEIAHRINSFEPTDPKEAAPALPSEGAEK